MVKMWVEKLDVGADESIKFKINFSQISAKNYLITIMMNIYNAGRKFNVGSR